MRTAMGVSLLLAAFCLIMWIRAIIEERKK